MTTLQAANLLNISRTRVNQLIRAGRLTATKQGRDYEVTRAAVEAVMVRTVGRPRNNTSVTRLTKLASGRSQL